MQNRARELTGLENGLGYRFKRKELLDKALSHCSYSKNNNEKMEFLGDRVLGLLVADVLYRYKERRLGEMAEIYSQVVSKHYCAMAAQHFGLGGHIRLSTGEESTGGRKKPALLADAMEAVLGAAWQDGGIEAARRIFDRYWPQQMELKGDCRLRDPKTELQEWSQAKKKGLPAYTVVGQSGEDHKPVFEIKLLVEGYKPVYGTGHSKQSAQQAAARKFMEAEG